MEEGQGPVRSSALELEIFVLWAQGPNKDPSLVCVLGRGQDIAKLPSPWPGLPTELLLCVVWCAGYSGLRAPYLGEKEGQREGQREMKATCRHPSICRCICRHIHCPRILGFLGGAGSPAPKPPSSVS